MPRIIRPLAQGAALAAVLLTAAGCDHPEFEKARIKLGGWTQARMMSDGWLKAPPEPQSPQYCYATLADPDCHAEPQPGEELRLTVPQVPDGGE